MDLTGSDGQRFRLKVAGYQFPDRPSAEYDSNWLNITIRVTQPQGRWTSTEPSLLTYEATALADWLEAQARGTPTEEEEESFVEPNLLFRIVEVAGRRRLQVHLDAEYLPPWVESRVAGETPTCLEFSLEEVDLLQAARALRGQLELFPQRAKC